jgi:acyl-CoA dehydrogenase
MSAYLDTAVLDAVEPALNHLAHRARRTNSSVSIDEFGASWRVIEEIGLPTLLIPESAGGTGASWREFLAVGRRIGYHALPLPLSETILARYLIGDHRASIPAGPLSIGLSTRGMCEQTAGTSRFSGTVDRIPWGRFAEAVVVECSRMDEWQLILLKRSNQLSMRMDENPAGEPRDTIVFENAPVTVLARASHSLFELGALSLSAQICGALERVLELCVRHVSARSQFGRPLAQFQAIQQQLAVLAEEAGACTCAAAAAAESLYAGDASFEIAAAKQYMNHAVTRSTAIAHQVHGAIGMTTEYELQRLTRRLWSWQTEFGDQRYWTEWLGSYVSRHSEHGLWPILTSRGDRSR